MIQTKQLPPEEVAVIQGLLKTLAPFFEMSGKIPARSVQAFLLVAEKEGASVVDYARRAAISNSTMSRNLLDIGERNRDNEPGFGLVVGRQGLMNRREREYRLTNKGRALVRQITKSLAGKEVRT